MNVTGVYGKDAMVRQIAKSVRIKREGTDKLMNNKTKWNFL
jgi:hypothetical protein